MMTKRAIREEMKFCSKRIRELHQDFMAEKDTSVALSKIEEMEALADRMAELDSKLKQILSAEFKDYINELVSKFTKD